MGILELDAVKELEKNGFRVWDPKLVEGFSPSPMMDRNLASRVPINHQSFAVSHPKFTGQELIDKVRDALKQSTSESLARPGISEVTFVPGVSVIISNEDFKKHLNGRVARGQGARVIAEHPRQGHPHS